MTIAGPAVAVLGVVLLGAGAGIQPQSYCYPNCGSPGQLFLIGGGVSLGVGVGMTAAGVAMLVKSRTHVRVDGMEVALKAPSGGTLLALGPAGLRF